VPHVVKKRTRQPGETRALNYSAYVLVLKNATLKRTQKTDEYREGKGGTKKKKRMNLRVTNIEKVERERGNVPVLQPDEEPQGGTNASRSDREKRGGSAPAPLVADPRKSRKTEKTGSLPSWTRIRILEGKSRTDGGEKGFQRLPMAWKKTRGKGLSGRDWCERTNIGGV